MNELLEKYPKVRDIVRELNLGGFEHCRGIEVYEVARELLLTTPRREVTADGKIDIQENIYVVTEDNYFPVARELQRLNPDTLLTTASLEPGEMVIDTIERMDLKPSYIVVVFSGQVIVKQESQPGFLVYVFEGNMSEVHNLTLARIEAGRLLGL